MVHNNILRTFQRAASVSDPFFQKRHLVAYAPSSLVGSFISKQLVAYAPSSLEIPQNFPKSWERKRPVKNLEIQSGFGDKPFSFLTLLIAFIFTLLPIPEWAIWLRPAWILLVLIFWSTVIPYQFNVGLAWFVGLCVDVMNGTLLGEHALAFAIVIYFASRFHSRFCMFSLVQQGLIVWFLVFFYQFIIFCIQGFIGDFPHNWAYWGSSAVSMLLWPWVFVILHDCRRRFRVS